MTDRIYIWGDAIPWNTGESKLKKMDIHPEYGKLESFVLHPGIFSRKKDFVGDMSGNDTHVFNTEIRTGVAGDRFDDRPYLVPHIVKGSDRCIISVPGGGYLNKAMDNEGTDIAAFLNKAGISCFVLWYRSYPYMAPVPWRDLQRAVRTVRAHSADYGINPRKIGVIGFSAGGHCCGLAVNALKNSLPDCPGYTPDATDRQDASVALCGLIYPAVDVETKQIFMEAFLPKELLADSARRAALAKKYTATNFITSSSPPQFVCYALNDPLIPIAGMRKYYKTLIARGVRGCRLLELKKGGHGFGGCCGRSFFEKRMQRGAECWKKEFTDWANGIFEAAE